MTIGAFFGVILATGSGTIIKPKADYKFYYINGVLFPAIFTPLILSGAWIGKAVQSGLIDFWGVGTAHGGGLCTSGLYTLIFFSGL